MEITGQSVAYLITMIHPEEKIIFWREEQMKEFLMVCRDFIPEEATSLVYCLLPDRLEMILFTGEGFHPIDICLTFQKVTMTYLELFGSFVDYPHLIEECGWIIKELKDSSDIEESMTRISALPVDLHLRKPGEPWNFASFAMPDVNIRDMDGSEGLLDYIDSILQEASRDQESSFLQIPWSERRYKH